MGKAVIILIVGITVIIGIVGVSMVGRTSDASKAAASTVNRAFAKNIAASSAEYYILQLKTNPTLRGTFSVSNLLGGTGTVTLSDWTYGVSDSVRLMSVSTYNNLKDTVTVKLLRGGLSFPILSAAISFRSLNPTLTTSGTLSFDGRDHDLNNAVLPPSANDRAGVAVLSASDTSIFVPAHASEINGTSDIIVDAGIFEPSAFVADMIARADYTLSGSYGGATWGSAASPVIVYCSGAVKFTNVVNGWGILICDKLESTNKFTFSGLVICTGNSDWKTSNTMKVIGGLLFSSAGSSKYNSTGVANIHYSTAGLNLAKQAAGSSGTGGYTVGSWFE